MMSLAKEGLSELISKFGMHILSGCREKNATCRMCFLKHNTLRHMDRWGKHILRSVCAAWDKPEPFSFGYVDHVVINESRLCSTLYPVFKRTSAVQVLFFKKDGRTYPDNPLFTSLCVHPVGSTTLLTQWVQQLHPQGNCKFHWNKPKDY